MKPGDLVFMQYDDDYNSRFKAGDTGMITAHSAVQPNKHLGARLEWGPKGHEEQRELVAHLKRAIQDAPCLVSRPGENTYECRIDSPCRVCQWRHEVNVELVEEWDVPDGIW